MSAADDRTRALAVVLGQDVAQDVGRDAWGALLADAQRDVPEEATAGDLAAYARGWIARDGRSRAARRTSPEASMAAWWRDVAKIGEGACWTKLPDGRTVPTHGEGGPPRVLSPGEAYCVGCPCGDGAVVHRAPCRMAAPQASDDSDRPPRRPEEETR